jgi:hypothetical protein
MTERIPKCIVHKGNIYPFLDNRITFWKHMYGNTLEAEFLIFSSKVSFPVTSDECLFIFEDDIHKYPEYFI